MLGGHVDRLPADFRYQRDFSTAERRPRASQWNSFAIELFFLRANANAAKDSGARSWAGASTALR